MQAKISNTGGKQLQATATRYSVVDTEFESFLLRVQPTGRKTFYRSYRTSGGKQKRIKSAFSATIRRWPK